MSQPAVDIDRIVREVLARLTEIAPRRQEDTAGCVTVSGRVVTLADVENRLEGKSKVSVPAGAVVTPAVKDYLRDRRIRLEYATDRDSPTRENVKLAVGVAETRFDPAELLRLVARHGLELERLAESGMVQAVDELANHIRQAGSLGLLLTDAGMAAVCLANRIPGVRAAAVRDVAEVRQAGESLGTNLLVVKPAGLALFALEQMVTEYCRGVRSCPEQYKGRLDES